MKKLIYVPIIHTEADMGSLAKTLETEFKTRHNQQKWEAHIKAIDEMWRGINEKIIQLNLDWQQARIYQDGLPVCGREMEIVTELAQKGSINHRILLDLIYRGAHLEGTEDGKLLIQEYQHLKAISQAEDSVQRDQRVREYNKTSKELLIKRDQFIAERIQQTLGDTETGILFMGMIHQVDQFLPRDIEIHFLIHRLPFGSAQNLNT